MFGLIVSMSAALKVEVAFRIVDVRERLPLKQEVGRRRRVGTDRERVVNENRSMCPLPAVKKSSFSNSHIDWRARDFMTAWK